VVGPALIRRLAALRVGQPIREIGPDHQSKAGTPTMGGLLILLSLGVSVLLWADLTNRATWTVLVVTFGYGVLGFVDDYRKVRQRNHKGVSARTKLFWQWLLAFAVAGLIFTDPSFDGQLQVPFFKTFTPDIGWLYVPLAAFVIVAMSNGVNLTDGLDGLSGGTVAIAFVAYMLIALLNVPNQENLALLCALVIGALLGFLWFNVHPAQVFIGDSGALALGATLAVTALITGQILVLPLIGIIFVIETGSVIIQVAVFKATGGRRLFRFTPLHHHFELGGWDEEKITVRFWIIGILAALLGVTLFLASLDRLQ
jgi:phospho-N-acetylmuramoyl-pentapeptide-transferase